MKKMSKVVLSLFVIAAIITLSTATTVKAACGDGRNASDHTVRFEDDDTYGGSGSSSSESGSSDYSYYGDPNSVSFVDAGNGSHECGPGDLMADVYGLASSLNEELVECGRFFFGK